MCSLVWQEEVSVLVVHARSVSPAPTLCLGNQHLTEEQGKLGFRGHGFNCVPLSRTGFSTPGAQKKKAELEKCPSAK